MINRKRIQIGYRTIISFFEKPSFEMTKVVSISKLR